MPLHAPLTQPLGPFRLSALHPDDAPDDHRAIVRSAERIRGVFGPDNQWPPAGLSYEENLRDLERHWGEFQRAEAFAYVVRDEAGRYLGCLYLKPFKSRIAQDARCGRFPWLAFLWVDEPVSGAPEAALHEQLRGWVASLLPSTPIWPGRDLSWASWGAMAERSQEQR